MAKLTFKNRSSTGRYASFQTKWADIKLDNKVCGSISVDCHGVVKVYATVQQTPSKEDPASFRNVLIYNAISATNAKATMQTAKEWFRDNFKNIQAKFALYLAD